MEPANSFLAIEVLVAPFGIQIGRRVVVADPWGNRLALLDTGKRSLVTDEQGHILGNAPKD